MTTHRQVGQVLLIVVLALAVGTTVALSLIGRTTIDVSINTQLEESSRAFSAAEAGIEEALRSGQGTAGAQILTSGVTYNVTVASVGGSAGVYHLPNRTSVGDTEAVWLVDHNADGSLKEVATFTGEGLGICWSYEQPIEPAVVISILYMHLTLSPVAPVPISFNSFPLHLPAAVGSRIITKRIFHLRPTG